MKNDDRRRFAVPALSILWLGVICWVAFVSNLGNLGLFDETEPLFVEASRQMIERNDWITPYFNDKTRFDKPPLVYWLMALGFKFLGVHEWVARLPSVLAAIGLVTLVFYTIKTVLKGIGTIKRQETLITAGIGAAMTALNPITITWARSGVSDMLLSGCLCSALLAFFLGYVSDVSTHRNRWYLTFYVLISLAILTKGPVGIVLPGIIILAFTLFLGNWREVWQEIKPVRGILLVLALSLPWYILVTLANGKEYLDIFFGYHNFDRFTNVVNRHSAPLYFYFPVVLIGFFPWSIYLPLSLAKLRFWRRKFWQNTQRNQQLGLFATFWFLSIFIFFTIAQTKLPSYVLPLMPAAAILVALLWAEVFAFKWEREPKYLLISAGFNALFALALSGVVWYSPNWLGDDPAMPNLPQIISASGILNIGCFIWLLAGLTMIILLLIKQKRWIWSVNFIAFFAFLTLVITPASALVDQERQLPLRQIATAIVAQKLPSEEVLMTGFEKPSLVFYSRGHVSYFRSANATIRYLNSLMVNPNYPDSFLMVGYPKRFTDLGLFPDQYQVLAKHGAYQLARVFTKRLQPLNLLPG